MHASTLILSTLAAASSAYAQDLASLSDLIASVTADPAYSSLVASYATADPTSLLSQANSYLDYGLSEISEQAATATGSDAAYLSGLYTSLQAAGSSANAAATSALTITGTNAGNGAQQTTGATSGDDSDDSSDDSAASGSASASAEAQTGNGAAATAVPIALGAVGMAVLGML